MEVTSTAQAALTTSDTANPVKTSPIDVFICKGDRVCSAEPVLPGFSMSAETLFGEDK
jgi:hypothetical protein